MKVKGDNAALLLLTPVIDEVYVEIFCRFKELMFPFRSLISALPMKIGAHIG